MTVEKGLRAKIAEVGPIAVSEFVGAALYDPKGGFYQTIGKAGRRGDFLTAPEVGPLFGAVIGRAIDTWWGELGFPSPFCVFEWGAGVGTLARSVFAAEPEALRTGALRWHAIERSDAQRAHHPNFPNLLSSKGGPSWPAEAGVVIANELLDNLPFDLYQRSEGRWFELRVDVAANGFETTRGKDGNGFTNRLRVGAVANGFETVKAPVENPSIVSELVTLASDTNQDQKVTIVRQIAARDWLAKALASVQTGRVVAIDYGASTKELVNRGDWVRTFRRHSQGIGAEWLANPGSCDITTDVAFDQLQLVRKADVVSSQADFLHQHGLAELVEEGKLYWRAHSHIGDLPALQMRSRIAEAKALCDPDGMGAFQVLEWIVT